jgi:hypothetical protein
VPSPQSRGGHDSYDKILEGGSPKTATDPNCVLDDRPSPSVTLASEQPATSTSTRSSSSAAIVLAMTALKNCSKLKELDISNQSVGSEMVKAMAAAPTLRALNLTNVVLESGALQSKSAAFLMQKLT